VVVVVVTVVVGVVDVVLELVLDVDVEVVLVLMLVVVLVLGAEVDSWVEDVTKWVGGVEECEALELDWLEPPVDASA
jgi:hypothetical protein